MEFQDASCVPLPLGPPPAAKPAGSDGIVGLGLAHHQFSLGAGHLLRDGDGSVLHVQVRPEKGQQFSPPQSRGQLQIERSQ